MDSDADLTFSITNSPPADAGVSLDSNRYIDINPTPGYAGTVPVVVEAMDTSGFTDTDTFEIVFADTQYVYLPLVLNGYPPTTGPVGYWEGVGVEFYVTPGATHVERFAVYVNVLGCGTYKITRLTSEPLVNDQFSFTGSYYASGALTTYTTASGNAGLDNFSITDCGYVSTSGAFPWTADVAR